MGTKYNYDEAIGTKINHWTILENVPREKGVPRKFVCKCDCGTVTEKIAVQVFRGHVTNCGCVRRNKTIARNKSLEQRNAVKKSQVNKRRGLSQNKKDYVEYNSWAGIKQRCYNKNHPAYPNYGGRGIKMCIEWFESFEIFLSDIGPRPEGDFSLDRIDNDGNYEPSNCRWADRKTQNNNQRVRKDSPTGFPGVTIKWGMYSVKVNTKYLGSFKTLEEAVKVRDDYKKMNRL